jgi:KUP system potassium uptake protein
LALAFRKSDNLAAAYGIAVSATMLATSALLFIAMREIWGWGFLRAVGIAGVFIVVDISFFAANSSKIASGGYVPLLLAAIAYGIMLVWHRGATAVSARLQEWIVPIGAFIADISRRQIPRVPGTAVYLTRTKQDVPPVMVWNLSHNRALHERLFVLTVDTDSVPWVNDAGRLTIAEVALNSGARRPVMDSWSGLIFRRCSVKPMSVAVASSFLTSPIMWVTRRFSPARMAKDCRNGLRRVLH